MTDHIPADEHASDCALHNAPALPVGPCDCKPHTHIWKWANINNIDYCQCGAQRAHEVGTQ